MTHHISTFQERPQVPTLRDSKNHVEALRQRIKDLNPDNILKRGYSITIKGETKEVIVSADQVVTGEAVTVKLYRGELGCSVLEKRS